MGIALIAQLLVRPGDVVAVEEYGYPPAAEAFRRAGAELVPLPVDTDGLVVDALEALCARRSVRAVYVTPHHQYPTMALLSAPRRAQLMAVAERYAMAVVEDDYDNEFHYDGRPVRPLASDDPRGQVLYVGTLSKVLSPGLRIGYVVAPSTVIEALASLRACIDRQGDQVAESAVAELLEDGELERHIRRMGRIYRARRDHVVARIRDELADRLEVVTPRGGMAVWTRVTDGTDPARWSERARAEGVLVGHAARYRHDGATRPFLRIGFAALTEAEIDLGVRTLAKT